MAFAVTCRWYWRRRLVVHAVALAVVAAGLVLSLTTRGRALAGDALPYTRGYLVTGDYVVGGVDLTEEANPPGTDGMSTGAVIQMTGVPANADILAAYLFWETLTLEAQPSQAKARFRGVELDLDDTSVVKRSSTPPGSTGSCWSSGSPVTMTAFRADVLRFLPILLDTNNKPTGKRLVNSSDLAANGFTPHTVDLPITNGNNIPESAGATLWVVYRDLAQPLRKIVLYDGIYVQGASQSSIDVMTQSIQGFYKSAQSSKSAKITHILGSGQPNAFERIRFTAGSSTQTLATNPVTLGTASQRGWSNLTYPVSALMQPGTNTSDGYGETVTTTVDHAGGGGYDCLTWAAVAFSTAVADVDNDGLPDGVEAAGGPLKDPNDQELPDLYAMGATLYP